ncbi:arylsulfatase [Mycobacterium sp. MS1601]|uniref:arylsulfatase n=1 Tax=Mycobacterium sp. MS1601 TaxID=1936029 RepID=UPI0009791755|nr:arylsulfatase [Mycobacterium sp. MS1601]AQA06036.1 arylsulfatase [Mycobacterium sp. MS1601]
MDFQGTISTDIRDSVPDWAPYRPAEAPTGAPNVLYLLWDDTGIATWDCFGGLVEMPNMKRLADRGVRLSQFHTTALCSPTRAALLTGRNPTSVGVSSVVNMVQGFPGQHGRIPAETALMSEVLAERGWSTYAVGKWHLAPLDDCHAAGSRRLWPQGRGFDRFYGFLDGMTDQWYPSLVSDSRHIDPPASPEDGYHLSQDLADNTIGFLRDHRAAAPDKPWFLYLCPGAGHSPHQVPVEWADRYRGRFDMGYERYREIALTNQKALGLIPDDTELSPMNPNSARTSSQGLPWPAGDEVLSWDLLSDDEKTVQCRMAEVFAGFLSYTDAQIGRVLDFLEETGQLDNTIIVAMSDNGASGEGGPTGTLHETIPMQGSALSAEDALRRMGELGGPSTQMNYSTGWAMAFNTPYKMFKRYASQEGGIADPCIISWPAGLSARGAVCDQYVHVSDVTPTMYDLLGLPAPTTVKGIVQKPLEGTSFASALLTGTGDGRKTTQFYSMLGTRGIWHQGWFANAVHPPTSLAQRGWSHFDDDTWELFHLDRDRSQIRDLAAEHPDRLEELKALWHENAVRYQAYPLNDLSVTEIVARGFGVGGAGASTRSVFYPGTPAGHTPVPGLLLGRSFTLRATLSVDRADACGVVFSQGNRAGGHALFFDDGRVNWVANLAGTEQVITSVGHIDLGRNDIQLSYLKTGSIEGSFDVLGDAELTINGRVAGARRGVPMAGLDMLQTVSAGRSVSHSVSSRYSSPFPLRGATLDEVSIEVRGESPLTPRTATDVGFARD